MIFFVLTKVDNLVNFKIQNIEYISFVLINSCNLVSKKIININYFVTKIYSRRKA